MTAYLEQDIKFLTGVGPKRAEWLDKELHINTFRDLLYYFPYKYVDRTKFYTVKEIQPVGAYIQVRGRIVSMRKEGAVQKERLVVQFSDHTGTISLLFFKGIQRFIHPIAPQIKPCGECCHIGFKSYGNFFEALAWFLVSPCKLFGFYTRLNQPHLHVYVAFDIGKAYKRCNLVKSFD